MKPRRARGALPCCNTDSWQQLLASASTLKRADLAGNRLSLRQPQRSRAWLHPVWLDLVRRFYLVEGTGRFSPPNTQWAIRSSKPGSAPLQPLKHGVGTAVCSQTGRSAGRVAQLPAQRIYLGQQFRRQGGSPGVEAFVQLSHAVYPQNRARHAPIGVAKSQCHRGWA